MKWVWGMCEFKNCRGVHQCLLRETSPCPGVCQSEASTGRLADIASRLGLRGNGFLDQGALIAALGIDTIPTDAARSADIIRIAEVRQAEEKSARVAS